MVALVEGGVEEGVWRAAGRTTLYSPNRKSSSFHLPCCAFVCQPTGPLRGIRNPGEQGWKLLLHTLLRRRPSVGPELLTVVDRFLSMPC